MSSLSEINFHYDRAVREAERLEAVSARLAKAGGDEMEDLLNEIYRIWKSDSSAQYLRKGQTVKTDLQTAADNMKKIAERIRAIAEEMRKAELEARRIVNEKNA